MVKAKPLHMMTDQPFLSLLTLALDERARRLESSRLRRALFKALQVDSYTERQASLEKIIQVVKSYMRMSQATTPPMKSVLPTTTTSTSPIDVPSTNKRQSTVATATSSSTADADMDGTTIDTTETPNATATARINTKSIHPAYDDISSPPMTYTEIVGPHEELHYFLLTMLRLSYTCPFRDVRQAFQQFLQTTLVSILECAYTRKRNKGNKKKRSRGRNVKGNGWLCALVMWLTQNDEYSPRFLCYTL